MNENIYKALSSVVRSDSLQTVIQQVLWPDQGQEVDRPSVISGASAGDIPSPSALNSASLNQCLRLSKTLQDLLLSEALLAAKLSVDCDSLEKLQARLITHFSQNSQETRIRYS